LVQSGSLANEPVTAVAYAATLGDAGLIKQVNLGLRTTNDPVFSKTGYANGDINQDGATTLGDAGLAKQRGDALAQILKEAGSAIYAQAPGAKEKGPYRHVNMEGEPPSGGRPSGSGPRGRVVDADYEESS